MKLALSGFSDISCYGSIYELWLLIKCLLYYLLYYHSDHLKPMSHSSWEVHPVTILIPKVGAHKHLDDSCIYSRHLPRLYLNIYWSWAAYLPSVFKRRNSRGFSPLRFLCWKLLSRSCFIIKLSHLPNALRQITPWGANGITCWVRNPLYSGMIAVFWCIFL